MECNIRWKDTAISKKLVAEMVAEGKRSKSYIEYIKKNGYIVPVRTYNNGCVNDVAITQLMVGDIVKTTNGTYAIVVGMPYDDGIDDIIPIQYKEGKIEKVSPLLLQ